MRDLIQIWLVLQFWDYPDLVVTEPDLHWAKFENTDKKYLHLESYQVSESIESSMRLPSNKLQFNWLIQSNILIRLAR